MKQYPTDWTPNYNGSGTPCDMLEGPCCCGATHLPFDFLPRPEKIESAILVTHRNCLDGCGASILFLNAGGKRENIRYVTAGGMERFVKKDPLMKTGDFLVFADIGLTSSKCADALERRGNVVLVDHHATSQHLSGRRWCHVSMDACGTELLRRYLRLEEVCYRRLASTIDDFDRGFFKLEASRKMADWQVFAGQEDFVTRFENVKFRFGTDALSDRLVATIPWWSGEEEGVLEILQHNGERDIEEALSRAFIRVMYVNDSVGGTVDAVYVISSCMLTSQLLQRALDTFPSAKFAAQVNIDKNCVSLRSRNPGGGGGENVEFDVAAIAKSFGGGGHKAAAGHPLPKDLLRTIAEEVHS